MSIQATEATWAADVSPPSRKLVLLFMAHKHNGQTGQLNPSVETVARGCGITSCQARRHLHALIEDGFLQVVGNDGGGAPGSTRSYRLMLDRARTGATPSMDATPSTDAREGSHPRTGGLAPMHERASTDASQTGMKGNEKEMNRNSSHAQSLHAIPDDFQPDESGKQFAQQLGLDWQREADAFRDYFKEQDIPSIDWQANWRSWCCDSAQTA
jgi:hypothetical protein